MPGGDRKKNRNCDLKKVGRVNRRKKKKSQERERERERERDRERETERQRDRETDREREREREREMRTCSHKSSDSHLSLSLSRLFLVNLFCCIFFPLCLPSSRDPSRARPKCRSLHRPTACMHRCFPGGRQCHAASRRLCSWG